MTYDKAIIGQIIGIENWAEFEEFIKDLYAKNTGTLNIERNFRAKGASGRNREIDVLVKFGFNPHVISLGIECKYWNSKVDGDVIDVIAGKKEDLKIDKFAVITTIGFEAGAELYAKAKGIDIFVIRPTNDDDFGYSGRVIKCNMQAWGSRPIDVGFAASVIASPGSEQSTSNYAMEKLSRITFVKDESDWDRNIDLYRYTTISLPNGGTTFLRGAYVNNLAKLILETWKVHNENFYFGRECSVAQKILFKEPTAIFLDGRIPILLNEITYKVQYIRHDWSFQVDRGEQYPVVLENVIENVITPLRANKINNATNFSMDSTVQKTEFDYSKKPDDVVGREGVSIKMLLNLPISSFEKVENGRYYELANDEDKLIWKELAVS
jgi:hypothetical protein